MANNWLDEVDSEFTTETEPAVSPAQKPVVAGASNDWLNEVDTSFSAPASPARGLDQPGISPGAEGELQFTIPETRYGTKESSNVGVGETLLSTVKTFPDRVKAVIKGIQLSRSEKQAEGFGLPDENRENVSPWLKDAMADAGVEIPTKQAIEDATYNLWNEYQDIKTNIQEQSPKYKEQPYMQFLHDAVNVVEDMGIAVLAGAVTRNPNVTLGAMGVQAYGGSYPERRIAGENVDEARLGAGITSLIETVTEKIPMSILFKKGTPFLKRALEVTLGEGFQEGITSVMQSAYDKGTIQPDMTLTQAIKAAGYESLLGAAAGAALAPIGHISSKFQPKPDSDGGPTPVLVTPKPTDDQPLKAEDILGDEIDLPDIEPLAPLAASEAPEQTEIKPEITEENKPDAMDVTEPVIDDFTPETDKAQDIEYFDSRLKRDVYRDLLTQYTSELTPGGDISVVPTEEGGTARTPSINPDWFKSLMEDKNYSMPVEKVLKARDKALAGERLGVRQSRVIEGILDIIQHDRISNDLEYARRQLEVARAARAKAGMPDAPDWLFEEQDYPDEVDGLSRTFMEMREQAVNISPELGNQVDELMDTSAPDDIVLDRISKLLEENSHGQQIEAGLESYQGPETAPGISDAGTGQIPGEPAPGTVGPGIGTESGLNRPAEPGPVPAVEAPAIEQEPIRSGHDDKYDIDVSMSRNPDGGYTITETGEISGRPKIISFGAGGVYLNDLILNMEGEFVGANQIVQAGIGSQSSDQIPWKGTPEERQHVIDLVAEIEFSRSISDMETVEKLESELFDFINRKSDGKSKQGSSIPVEKQKTEPVDRRKKAAPGRKEKRTGKKRREDWAYRKKIDEMTGPEKDAVIERLRRDAHINELTGINNRKAWESAEKKDYIASIDVDSLKWVNDNMGNKAGDQLLIEVANVLHESFGEDAYHVSGDEFWVQSNNEDELRAKLEKAQRDLRSKSIEGNGLRLKGLQFSFGIADNETDADRAMKADKSERFKSGERVDRGETPYGVEKLEVEAKPKKQHPGKKKDLAGEVDEKAQAKRDAEIAKKEEQAKKQEAAENYQGEPDLLSGGQLEPDLFAPEQVTDKQIETSAHEAATSPENKLPEPTEAQKGNQNEPVTDNWREDTDVFTKKEAAAAKKKREDAEDLQKELDYINKDLYNWFTPKEIAALQREAPSQFEPGVLEWWSDKLVEGQQRGWPKGKKAPGKKEKPERFEEGKKLSKEKRLDVLKSVIDVYKENNVQKIEKGVDSRGETMYGYPNLPELFVKSDITGHMLRYYITLPDGKIAHPTELYPEITQSSIDNEMLARKQEEKQKELAVKDKNEIADRLASKDKNKANQEFWKWIDNSKRVARIKPEETQLLFSESEGKYLRILNKTSDKWLSALKERGYVEYIPSAEKPAKKTEEKITDFGEKIGGARKDVYQRTIDAYSKELPDDISKITLAKFFPEPDYKLLVDAGLSPEQISFIDVVRGEVPSKPRKAWKQKQWVGQLKVYRELSQYLISDPKGDNLGNNVLDSLLGKKKVNESQQKMVDNLKPLMDKVKLNIEMGFPESPSVKKYDIRKVHFSLFNGEKDVNKWQLTDRSKSSGFGGMGNQMHFDTREDAIKALKTAQALAGDPKSKTKIVKFDIWSERGATEKGIIVGKKVGARKFIELKTGFKSAKEARESIIQNQGQLEIDLENKKKIPKHRREINNTRVGKDYRNGVDVTPDQFGETFGFRGVEFGNWVEQGKRQQDLNDAYDGLLDLADILNIPAKAISLNGTLGLAFGARGHGSRNGITPAAHYESDHVVINLTKKNGAGSLGHEWWHSLDNYFGNQLKRGDFLTEKRRGDKRIGYDNVRLEVRDAFDGVMKAIEDSGLVDRSKKLDTKKSKDYWSTNVEMSARAFESFIISKIADNNASNDYLANIVSEEYYEAEAALFGEPEDSYPYIKSNELEGVVEAYNNLFNVMKTKETDKGIALFSKYSRPKGGPKPKGMPVKAVENVANEFINGFDNHLDLEIRIYPDKQSAFGIEGAKKLEGETVKGAYFGKSRIVVLVASDLNGKADAIETLRHEILTHHGLNTFKPKDKKAIIDSVSNSRSARSLKKIWERVDRDYAGKSEAIKADEVIALISKDKQGVFTKAWARIVAAIRRALRAAGIIKDTVTKTELKDLINVIASRLDRGVPMQTFPESDDMQFQEEGKVQPVYYSQMVKVLSDKLNASGSTKSYRDQIAAFAKKGMFKQEELEWSGVNEWLDSMIGKKISKADVISFLDANQIQVQEVKKGGTVQRPVRDRLAKEYDLPEDTGNWSIGVLLEAGVPESDRTAWDKELKTKLDSNVKFEQYQLPGGENYREIVLTLPGQIEPYKPDNVHFTKEGDGTAVAWIRFNERTDAYGNRILFIEEVQSKRHQEGRKIGYKDEKIIAEYKKLDSEVKRLTKEVSNFTGSPFNNPEFDDLNKRQSKALVDRDKFKEKHGLQKNALGKLAGVPDAPFKTTWPLLAMKRMIRYASENGFDSIAWTTGEQQADRYDLSKYIESINVKTHVANNIKSYKLEITDIKGEKVRQGMPVWLAEEEIADYVGKDLAEKIIEKGKTDNEYEYSGLDLKVGGEGMQAFYDKMLPSMVNKYVKKWGGKVGETDIKLRNGISKLDILSEIAGEDVISSDEISAVHSLEITNDMRRSALEGQPMFSRTKGDDANKRKYTPEQLVAIKKGVFGHDITIEKNPLKAALGAAKNTIDETKQVWKTILRQGFLDQYDSFRTIINDKRAWMMANLSEASGGAVEAALEYGRPFMYQGAVDVDTDKKSLSKILEPLGNEVNDWLKWIAGNRAERLATEDRERLFKDIHIEALISLSDSKQIRNSDLDGKNRSAIYEAVRKDFEEMNDAFVKIGVDTGIISPGERILWKQQGFYVPFYRIAEEEGGKFHGPFTGHGLVKQTAYKRLKGADIPLGDLLTNVVLNWSHIVSAGLKNQAAIQALSTAEEMGLAEQIKEKDKSKDAVFIRMKGKKVWLELDNSKEGQLVLESLMSLNFNGLNNFMMKAARKFKRLLTYGVTADPEFKIANLIRDSVQAMAVAGMSTNLAKNIIQGFRSTKKGNPTIARMIAGGGAFGDSGYIHGTDPEALQRLISKDVDRMTILDSPKRIQKMWDAYQDFGARLENVNRAASFEQDLSRGDVDLLEANFNSRDITDFQRTGAFISIRMLAQVVPFLNARLQGLSKLGRSAFDPNQKRQFKAVMGVYALASILLYLYMKDDDDYDEAPQWERDTYHLFKIPGSDIMFRIPRPFEVGFVASMAERMVEQLVDDKAHGKLFMERLWHGLSETLSFNPIPQMIMPAVEIWANKNTFTDRAIESESMKNLSPSERRRAWTSETAIAMSKGFDTILWDDVVLSPLQIEHLVNGYFGWIGGTVLESADSIIRMIGLSPSIPDRKIQDYVVLGRFARTGPTRGSKYTTEFYENMRDANRAYADIRFSVQLGNEEKAMKIAEKNKDKLAMRGAYMRAQKAISDINKRILMIRIKNIPSDEKETQMDSLNKMKNEITKRIIEKTMEYAQ